MNSFKKSLIHNRNALAPKNSGLKDLAEVPVYHGQILEEDSDGSLEGDDWYQGKLKFKKHIDDAYRIGGDGRKVDDIVVIDPRKDRK